MFSKIPCFIYIYIYIYIIYLFIYHNGKLPDVKLLRVWDYGFSLNPQRLFNKINPQLFAHTLHRLFPPVKIMTHWSVVSFASTTFMKVGRKLDHKPSQSWRKERERERKIFHWYTMHDALPMFFSFSDFFLDFNKEKGVVKGPFFKNYYYYFVVASKPPWPYTW